MDAAKRLRKEIKEIRKESLQAKGDPDIVLHPDEDNIHKWTAYIRGPRDTPFENGTHPIVLFLGFNGKLGRYF